MSPAVRIGAVSFLNARPLVHGLEHGLGAGRIDLVHRVPAELARRMAAGDLDVALLPVAALAELPELEIVPGLGITTRGAARSVLLVSRTAPEEITSLALDPESRTSNLLARLLLLEVWGRRPRAFVGPLELDAALAAADAAVRIGDKALAEPVPAGCRAIDLGEAWTAATGLPFVFAAWVARPGVVDRALYRLLHESKRAGVREVERIAAEFAANARCDGDLALRYLTEHIHYRLGAAELEAIRLFFATAARAGLIPQAPTLRLALRPGACDAPRRLAAAGRSAD